MTDKQINEATRTIERAKKNLDAVTALLGRIAVELEHVREADGKQTMTNITDRLRHFQKVFKGPNFAKAYHDMGDEIGQAADTIERLQVALQRIDKFVDAVQPKPTKQLASIQREARAALGKMD